MSAQNLTFSLFHLAHTAPMIPGYDPSVSPQTPDLVWPILVLAFILFLALLRRTGPVTIHARDIHVSTNIAAGPHANSALSPEPTPHATAPAMSDTEQTSYDPEISPLSPAFTSRRVRW